MIAFFYCSFLILSFLSLKNITPQTTAAKIDIPIPTNVKSNQVGTAYA